MIGRAASSCSFASNQTPKQPHGHSTRSSESFNHASTRERVTRAAEETGRGDSPILQIHHGHGDVPGRGAYCRAPRRRCSKDEPEVKRQRRLLLLVMPCSQYRDGARTVARAAALPPVARRRRPRARGRGRSRPDGPGPRWDAMLQSPQRAPLAAVGTALEAAPPATSAARDASPRRVISRSPCLEICRLPFSRFPLRHSNLCAVYRFFQFLAVFG